jgi:hypothetical protein
VELPVGPLFCVLNGPTRGASWSRAAARAARRDTAVAAGVRRRFAPHQLRHAHAVELAREGVPLIVIQRQLGHSHLGITSVYLQGMDNAEIIDTVHARRAPMIRPHVASALIDGSVVTLLIALSASRVVSSRSPSRRSGAHAGRGYRRAACHARCSSQRARVRRASRRLLPAKAAAELRLASDCSGCSHSSSRVARGNRTPGLPQIPA